MPNDPAGSFPVPPTDNQPARSAFSSADAGGSPPENPPQEVKLTDEVAPDLSAVAPAKEDPSPSPAETTNPTPVLVTTTTTTSPTPSVANPPLAEPVPATIPANISKPFPIVTLILLLISIGAIAATYFFYQQARSLNTQLSQITQTLQQQTIKENQTTITPTTEVSPTSTISAITPTPTANPTPVRNGSAWNIISDVMATAQKTYPNAQLILVKAENVNNLTQTIKYFFRQNATDKKYFYLLKEIGKDLSLVDQNVVVFENSPLPSLNSAATGNQLGLDLNEAVTIATSVCPTTFDCVNTPITGQYVKSNVLLWQISYKPATGQPFVVQIDATTKKIIYKSL